tara:strand:- start:1719 stop:3641 length:1923 start_codon:yes stop_codon:yes gene_type:complete
MDNIELALRIRVVESKFLEMFSAGMLNGTVHTSVGQEFSGVAFCNNLIDGDAVFSNHRCHGHYLALTKNIKSLMAELMGKKSGVCSGIGGSQHLCESNFFSNGPQGSLTPVAAGLALGMKKKENGNIAVCFIGDGTMGEGILYESMNLSALYQVPIIYVCENNQYAQSTHISKNLSGSILERAKSFGLDTFSGNTWDYEDLIDSAKNAIDHARKNKPSFFMVDTYRLNAHSKGDDDRPEKEVSLYNKKDPINKMLRNKEIKELYNQIKKEVDIIVEELMEDEELSNSDFQKKSEKNFKKTKWIPTNTNQLGRQSEKIYQYFKDAMNKKNSNICIIGEDIAHPYGGAFKVTKDLSKLYPDNIISTPISEAGITGLGIGMGLAGFKPYVEIMFGDFISYAFDQILSNASKFYEMYNNKARVPLVIRTPMGGGRGYGPTHSQSLEKFFNGMNNIKVVALNYLSNIDSIYKNTSQALDTVLLIENKIDYSKLNINMPKNITMEQLCEDSNYPAILIKPKDITPDISLITYGGSLHVALESVDQLYYEHELVAQVICLTQIYPLNMKTISDIVSESEYIATIEESNIEGGYGSEIIANLVEIFGDSSKKYIRIGSKNYPIPSVKSLEDNFLVNSKKIVDVIGSKI